MAVKTELVEFVRALLEAETERSADLEADLAGKASMQEFADVVTITLFTAAEERFLPGDNPRKISKFVLDVKDSVELSDEEFPPAVAEAIVRAGLGEERLLEGIDLVPTIPAQMAIIARIITDEQFTPGELDAFFGKVTALAMASNV